MRIVPVMDLLDGRVVHGTSEDREDYEPIESEISESPDPLSVARSFQDLGLGELYVADLNAISLGGDNLEVIDELSSEVEMDIMVDGGFRTAEDVEPYVGRGISSAVLATETLEGFEVVEVVVEEFDLSVTGSVDLKGGEVLANSPGLNISFSEVIGGFSESGASEIILLDLGKVGESSGPPEKPVARARDLTSLPLLAGGGVRDMEDLYHLGDLGASGALVATALHSGSIDKNDIAQL